MAVGAVINEGGRSGNEGGMEDPDSESDSDGEEDEEELGACDCGVA